MLFPSTLLLAYSLGLAAILFWDVRGAVGKVRARFESRGFDGVRHRRLPNWAFSAFNIWCLVFGIGQFAYFWSRDWRH